MRSLSGLAVLFVVPMGLFAVLRLSPGIDPSFRAEEFHFWIVSIASVLGLLISVAILRASAGRDDIWVFFIGLGFLSISGVFLLHSLTTENVIFDRPHPSFAISPPGSLASGAILLGLSAVRYPKSFEAILVRSRLAILAVWAAAYSAYTITLFTVVELPDTVQGDSGADAGTYGYAAEGGGAAILFIVVTGATALLFALALARYARLLRRRNSVVLIAVMAGLVLFLDAEISMMFSSVWSLSWWLYHVAMLSGFLVIGYGFLLEYRHHQTLDALFDGITLRDAKARIDRDYNDATRALVAAVEAKDAYTRGHSSRVSEFAVVIADQYGLNDRAVDRIRHAAVLHDIGKIAVSEQILNKEGGLEETEREAVQRHPDAGHTMVEGVASLRPMIPGIRGHHERFDGKGYPDGLANTKIPLDARLIAVADVFDALTSDRSYRPALSTAVATKIIRDGSGTHFDPKLVDAFLACGLAVEEDGQTAGTSGLATEMRGS